ncbi:hypothetical protein [Arcobacter vandammei]|uniref:hypothetical protein n=1 Tax=Arcobacter vandammei TaxID=2782243 RepID=UPI0018DF0748|nr:hypothetical protein [Arcobacter vandammei]
MIPRGFFYKYMFLFLIYFLHGKLILWIFIFYVTTAVYFKVNDGTFFMNFIIIFLLLVAIQIFMKDNLNKELYRYKKYLVLKRKRANRSKNEKN